MNVVLRINVDRFPIPIDDSIDAEINQVEYHHQCRGEFPQKVGVPSAVTLTQIRARADSPYRPVNIASATAPHFRRCNCIRLNDNGHERRAEFCAKLSRTVCIRSCARVSPVYRGFIYNGLRRWVLLHMRWCFWRGCGISRVHWHSSIWRNPTSSEAGTVHFTHSLRCVCGPTHLNSPLC